MVPCSHAVVLDFEATCDDQKPPRPQEIIEFPSVLVDLRSLESVAEFESFVRPVHHPRLTAFCREFTAIRQVDVDRAEPFGAVLGRHERWLASHGLDETNALIVTCGDWDLATMLPRQCAAALPPIRSLRPIYRRWHNLKAAYCQILGKRKAPGMARMLKELAIPLVGRHHRGIDDCRNIAVLLGTLARKGAVITITGRLPDGVLAAAGPTPPGEGA